MNTNNRTRNSAGKAHEKSFFAGSISFFPTVNGLSVSVLPARIDRFILLACHRGELYLELNMVSLELHSGEVLVCCPTDRISHVRCSPDFDAAMLCLSAQVLLELFSQSDLWDCFFCFTENHVIRLREGSQDMLRLCGDTLCLKSGMGRTAFQKEIVCSVVRTVFYELKENLDEHSCLQAKIPKRRETLFKQFIGLLSACEVKPRSVSWYAAQLCITPKYLSSLCRKVSGKTAFEWINDYVAVDIRHLLKNTDMPIKEIVDHLAFPNVSFFGSYCRKHFGMPPMEYRRRLRNVDE